MFQLRDPKWSKVWANITPDSNYPHIVAVEFEVIYAGRPWRLRHRVDTRYPEHVPLFLDEMVIYLDRLIEEGSGMNSATQYTLDPENHEALRDNGFGKDAIDAMIRRDEMFGTSTIVVIKDSFAEVATQPLNREENKFAYELLERLEIPVGERAEMVFPIVKLLTHPDILPHLEALIEVKNPKIEE